MCLYEKTIEASEVTEDRVDGRMVTDVVTEIGHRRAVDRREPNCINTEAGNVVQSRTDAGEITYAVAVRVRKRARIDLIDDRRPPPRHLSIVVRIQSGTTCAELFGPSRGEAW